LAHSFAGWAATSEDFELAASQVLPIIDLRARATGLGPQELHALHSEIIHEANRDGQRWISGAVVNGENVIRTMIISYLIEERHFRGLQQHYRRPAIPALEFQGGYVSLIVLLSAQLLAP
jgi:hypothetical protein